MKIINIGKIVIVHPYPNYIIPTIWMISHFIIFDNTQTVLYTNCVKTNCIYGLLRFPLAIIVFILS